MAALGGFRAWSAPMIKTRDPFNHALLALRGSLRSGAKPPGSPLVVVDLARELDISPTPVREVLWRLTGEGTVEEARGRGFSVRRLEAGDLDALYQLHGVYIAAALKGGRDAFGKDASAATAVFDAASAEPSRLKHRAAIEALFTEMGRMSGNPDLQRALATVADRLSLARLVDADVFVHVDEERAALIRLWDDGDVSTLGPALESYHQRRRAAATQLAAAIRDRIQYRKNILTK